MKKQCQKAQSIIEFKSFKIEPLSCTKLQVKIYHQSVPTAWIPLTLSPSVYQPLLLVESLEGIQCLHKDG